MTARHLWLDPGFGVSGDMMLGALFGLGASPEVVTGHVGELDVDGWKIDVNTTMRAGLSATRAEVVTAPERTAHRRWSTIDRLLAQASLPSTVKAGSRKTFELLGRAEARIHGVDIDEVHFHEVGAVDAIVDIVGAWSALQQLHVSRVIVGPVGLGHGEVSAAHGRLPLPAPATMALLEGASVRSIDSPMETVTPTGAALLAAMVDSWGPIPSGRLGPAARGAGSRDPATHPNVLTAAIVEVEPAGDTELDDASAMIDTAHVLTTNLDDATPELIGHTIQQLLDAGADDAWVAPIVMKKSRPAHELRVMCKPQLADALRRIIFTETGTLGIRTETLMKHHLPRTFHEVDVRGFRIRIKAGPFSSKPEHDDLVEASSALGIPLKQLFQEALAAESGPSI